MSFTIIPAIDLLDGACVRLLHGDFKQCKTYDQDAATLAKRYAAAGAEWLHVVDLAASRDGKKADIKPLLRLLEAAPQCVQTGGGVRKRDDVQLRLDAGADRVVVGSICVTHPERFAGWLKHFGSDRLVAALDANLDELGTPWPRTHGWTRDSSYDLWRLLAYYSDRDLQHVLCTDIAKDGAMKGPNVSLYSSIEERFPELKVQASGGVSGLKDLRRLSRTGADSAIVGKALLEGCFTVEEALESLS